MEAPHKIKYRRQQAEMRLRSMLQAQLNQLTARPWTPRHSWLDLMASTALQTARG